MGSRHRRVEGGRSQDLDLTGALGRRADRRDLNRTGSAGRGGQRQNLDRRRRPMAPGRRCPPGPDQYKLSTSKAWFRACKKSKLPLILEGLSQAFQADDEGSIPFTSSFCCSRVNLPRKGLSVGLRIVLFEACSAFTLVAACTRALSPIRDTHSEGFSQFVTSLAAPAASGWSDRRVGLAPTGKRRLVTAHTQGGHRQDPICDAAS